jgi:hypothetical protein
MLKKHNIRRAPPRRHLRDANDVRQHRRLSSRYKRAPWIHLRGGTYAVYRLKRACHAILVRHPGQCGNACGHPHPNLAPRCSRQQLWRALSALSDERQVRSVVFRLFLSPQVLMCTAAPRAS